jgi:VWFA-related protein
MAALCSLLPVALSANVVSRQTVTPEQYDISVHVNLVVLPVSVVNQKGMLVSGLQKSNFRVYEDGILQSIKDFHHEDIPVTVGLVVDRSGSMGRKLPEISAAALAFAHSSNPDDEMFVVEFNESVAMGLPANMPFTHNEGQLEAAFAKLTATGKTAIYDAVMIALEHLRLGHRDKKVLIIVTDGGDNASKHTLAEAMAMAAHSNAIIYTIGLFDENDPDNNPGVLKQLARTTGGETFLPQSVSEVVAICEQIAKDIRSQYTIAYVPANAKMDGSHRTVRVTATAPGHGKLFVRTREGYFASRGETVQPAPAATGIQP